MDWDVIEQKLESLRRCLARIREKCPEDAAALARDYDAQDILSLNLSRAVQLCVDMAAHRISGTAAPAPVTMGQTFELLADQGLLSADLADRLKKAVGFRNLAMHRYEAIDWNIVYMIARQRLTDFEDFARVMMRARPD